MIRCKSSDSMDETYGTGFLIADNTILTVKHVVKNYLHDSRNCVIYVYPNPNTTDNPCEFELVDPALTEKCSVLALLRYKGSGKFPVDHSEYKKYYHGYKIPDKGQKACTYGFKSGKVHRLSYDLEFEGIADNPDETEFYNVVFKADFTDDAKGLSGSPIIYEDNLIGILGYAVYRGITHPYGCCGNMFFDELKRYGFELPNRAELYNVVVLAMYADKIERDLFRDCMRELNLEKAFGFAEDNQFFLVDSPVLIPTDYLKDEADTYLKNIYTLDGGFSLYQHLLASFDKIRQELVRKRKEQATEAAATRTIHPPEDTPENLLAEACIDSYDEYESHFHRHKNEQRRDNKLRLPEQLLLFDSFMDDALESCSDQEKSCALLQEAYGYLAYVYKDNSDYIRHVLGAKYYQLFSSKYCECEDQEQRKKQLRKLLEFVTIAPSTLNGLSDFPQRHILKGLLHLQNEQYPQARQAAASACELCCEEDYNCRADAFWLMGCAEEHLENPEASKGHFQQARDFSQQSRYHCSPIRIADELLYLARISRSDRDYSTAKSYLTTILDQKIGCEKMLDHYYRIIMLCCEAANHYLNEANHIQARQYMDTAIQYCKKSVEAATEENSRKTVVDRAGDTLGCFTRLRKKAFSENPSGSIYDYLPEIFKFGCGLELSFETISSIVTHAFFLDDYVCACKSYLKERSCLGSLLDNAVFQKDFLSKRLIEKGYVLDCSNNDEDKQCFSVDWPMTVSSGAETLHIVCNLISDDAELYYILRMMEDTRRWVVDKLSSWIVHTVSIECGEEAFIGICNSTMLLLKEMSVETAGFELRPYATEENLPHDGSVWICNFLSLKADQPPCHVSVVMLCISNDNNA